jgi:hypothetical protein
MSCQAATMPEARAAAMRSRNRNHTAGRGVLPKLGTPCPSSNIFM